MEAAGPFKCAWTVVDAKGEAAAEAVREFASRVEGAGHVLSGERRLIPRVGAESGFEVQLGVE